MSYFGAVRGLLNSAIKTIRATTSNELAVEIGGSNVSAFGDLVTAENTPVIQIDFVYGINTQLATSTIANTGTVDTNASRLRLQSGTNSAGSALLQSVRSAKYRPGQGITARFTTAFTAGVASNNQIVGIGSSIDGYFVGYNGTSFGLLYRANSVDTWTAQASFNNDTINGSGQSGFTIDPTKGNVWMIRYPYLGYGDIKFYVQNPNDATWVLFHIIKYANSSASVQVTNPNMFFYAQSINTGSTTNVTTFVGSVGVFLNGMRKFLGPQYGTSNRKTTITTQTNILTVRNATTYNTVTNTSLIRFNSLSVSGIAVAGGSMITLNVIKNTTLGGTLTYTAINGTTADNGVTITSGNSIASVNTAGTTITGGTVQFNAVLNDTNNMTIDLTNLDLFLEPGSIMTFSCTGSASVTCGVSVNWTEDI